MVTSGSGELLGGPGCWVEFDTTLLGVNPDVQRSPD